MWVCCLWFGVAGDVWVVSSMLGCLICGCVFCVFFVFWVFGGWGDLILGFLVGGVGEGFYFLVGAIGMFFCGVCVLLIFLGFRGLGIVCVCVFVFLGEGGFVWFHGVIWFGSISAFCVSYVVIVVASFWDCSGYSHGRCVMGILGVMYFLLWRLWAWAGRYF